MSFYRRGIRLGLCLGLVLFSTVLQPLLGDEPEASYLVKLAPPKQLFEQGRQLADDLGLGDAMFLVSGYEFQLKRCLDVDRPWGLYGNWSVAAGEPVTCFPTTEPEGLVELIALSLGVDWEEDDKAGVYRIGDDPDAPDYLIKVVGDWSFGHSRLEALESLPSNAEEWFKLEDQELIVATLDFERLNEQEIEAFIEFGRAEEELLMLGMSRAERRAFEVQQREGEEALRELIEVCQELRFTIKLDSDSERLLARFDLETRPDRELTGLVGIAHTPTRFPGFSQSGLLGASITIDFEDDADYANYLTGELENSLRRAQEQMPNLRMPRGANGYSPEALPRAFADATLAQIAAGRIDVAISAANSSNGDPSVMGAMDLNQDALDTLEAEIIAFIEYVEENAGGILQTRINARRIGDVRWHEMEFPMAGAPPIRPGQAPPAAPKVNFGFGEGVFYLAFGDQSMELFSSNAKLNKRLLAELEEAPRDTSVKELAFRFDMTPILPDPDDFLTEIQYPRVVEDLREGKSFLITAFMDSAPDKSVIAIEIDTRVLRLVGDRIDDVLESLESLDPAAGAGAPRF